MLRESERCNLLPEEYMLELASAFIQPLLDATIGDFYQIVSEKEKFVLTEGYDRSRETGVGMLHIGPTWQSALPKLYIFSGSNSDLRQIVNYGEGETADPAARKPLKIIEELIGTPTIVNMQGEQVFHQRKLIKNHLSSQDALIEANAESVRLSSELFSQWGEKTSSLQESIRHLCTTIIARCVFGVPHVDHAYLTILKKAGNIITNSSSTKKEKKECIKEIAWMSNHMITKYYKEIVDSDKFASDIIGSTESDTPEMIIEKLKATPLGGALIVESNLSFITMFAIAMLSEHPDVYQKLRSELAVHDGCMLDINSLNKLPYLNQIFLEVLRMTSPTAVLARGTSKKHTFKLSSGDLTVPPRSYLFVPVRRIHYDPTFWPKPYDFMPERFEGLSKNAFNIEHFMPFSHGSRSCPAGTNFVEVVFKTIIVNLVKDYEFTLDKKLETIPADDIHPRWKQDYSLTLKALDHEAGLTNISMRV